MTTLCGCGHEKVLHNHQTDFCKVEGCGCCSFISDVAEWKEAKARWDWEDAEEAKMWNEVYRLEQQERIDNEPPSGSTDLDNRGGTTFNY